MNWPMGNVQRTWVFFYRAGFYAEGRVGGPHGVFADDLGISCQMLESVSASELNVQIS